jgi:predicted outer membrane lipoprotein
MLLKILLVAHIAVLGYWLGSEAVINSTYRYVSRSSAMPFNERGRLMQHVMHVDQHVRYALILQAGLGFSLAAFYGWLPGGMKTAAAAGVVTALWLGFVEVVHHFRQRPLGNQLARFDRGFRYLLVVLLLALASGIFSVGDALPLWLRWKLVLFACIIACGVGIRLVLIEHFRVWGLMATEGVTDAHNASIRRIYNKATGVLLLLWLSIASIVVLSLWKP